MRRLASTRLAVIAGAALILLSATAAFAAKPDAGSNHGKKVSEYVHSLKTNTGSTDTPDTKGNTNQPDNHGSCVSAVAHSDAVGGKHNNHGGAVSEAARTTCAKNPSTADKADKESEASDAPDTDTDASEQPDASQSEGASS